jgi:DNA-binding NarL/FixJ family response regulator
MSVYQVVSAVRRDVVAPEIVCDVYELDSRRRVTTAVKELTSRQVAIGRMMSTGAKDAAIARELGLSLRTVRAPGPSRVCLPDLRAPAERRRVREPG